MALFSPQYYRNENPFYAIITRKRNHGPWSTEDPLHSLAGFHAVKRESQFAGKRYTESKWLQGCTEKFQGTQQDLWIRISKPTDDWLPHHMHDFRAWFLHEPYRRTHDTPNRMFLKLQGTDQFCWTLNGRLSSTCIDPRCPSAVIVRDPVCSEQKLASFCQ